MFILRYVNSMVAAIDFSDKVCFSQLHGLFRNSDISGILEEKDYCAADMVFPMITAHFNRATGF